MTDTLTFVVLVLLALGQITLAVRVWKMDLDHRKPAPVVNHTPGPVQNYGHPWSPVAEVTKKLPKAPSGYAWELLTEPDERGHYMLRLTIVNMSTGEDEGRKSVDLTWRSDVGRTWTSAYQRFPSLRREDFNLLIVGKLVDWALAEVAKRADEGPLEYKMV